MGFVPTMGALHSGHISLVSAAKKSQDSAVVASIFVNPTQFGQGEDLEKYPRTFERDLAMLSDAGVAYVFAPSANEMYGGAQGPPLCHVEPLAFGSISEGQARPNFFRGVATVVSKLFNIVQPTTAYFGQKDIAQCVLIRRMVKDLNFPVDIRVCETKREADGLAMSSRNQYLLPSQRPQAAVLYRALSAAREVAEAGGSPTPSSSSSSSPKPLTSKPVSRETIIAAATAILQREPLVSEIEYISIASTYDMREVLAVEAGGGEQGVVISAAIRLGGLGGVRLIDNVLVGKASNYFY